MPSIPADEWENGGYPETHYEPIRGMQTKPYDINFDEGLTAIIKAQENKTTI